MRQERTTGIARAVFAILVIFLTNASVQAGSTNAPDGSTVTSAGRRVALVIGNSQYKVSPLRNPDNDAAAVSQALIALGFNKVTLKRDLTQDGFRSALLEFSRDATLADIALLYFAGHGTERGGRNYLIPVDAKLERASDLDLQAIGLDTILSQLEGARQLKLVILDACRNNLFALAGGQRSQARGLARVEPDDNTLIAYAAKAGTTAEDGSGANSPFTGALLKHLPTRGLDVRLVLGQVRDEVTRATGGHQQPHVYGTLGGQQIYIAVPTPPVPPVPVAVVPSTTDAEIERLRAENKELRKKGEDDAKVAMLPPVGQEKIVTAPDKDKLTRDIQRELKRVGCEPDATEGEWGTKSRLALEEFSRRTKLTLAANEPTSAALKALTEQKIRVCPLQCKKGQVESDGTCVDAPKRQKPTVERNSQPRPRKPEAIRYKPAKGPSNSSPIRTCPSNVVLPERGPVSGQPC